MGVAGGLQRRRELPRYRRGDRGGEEAWLRGNPPRLRLPQRARRLRGAVCGRGDRVRGAAAGGVARDGGQGGGATAGGGERRPGGARVGRRGRRRHAHPRGGEDRIPDHGEGARWRGRARDAGGERGRGTRGSDYEREARGRGCFRRWRTAAGEAGDARAPRGGAGPGRQPWELRPPRGARLLGAAQAPEADRGDAEPGRR